ncbi:MAG: hypothetical protein J5954_09495 [Prevotella sp.]|nr:hypothetical protein [Prevotella sp.]
MAQNIQLKLPYVLRKNKSSNPRMSGKYYGRVWVKDLLDTRGLANHMVEHGIVRNNSKVYTILSKLQECIPELLSQGVGVKLDGLGTFYPSLESKGVANPKLFNAGKDIKGIHIRILPWSEKTGNLTSKAFLRQCELEYVGEVETITVDGKKKVVLHRYDPEEEGGEG